MLKIICFEFFAFDRFRWNRHKENKIGEIAIRCFQSEQNCILNDYYHVYAFHAADIKRVLYEKSSIVLHSVE